jgi:hypothetical protein
MYIVSALGGGPAAGGRNTARIEREETITFSQITQRKLQTLGKEEVVRFHPHEAAPLLYGTVSWPQSP